MAEKFKFDNNNLEIKEESKAARILKIILADITAIFLLVIVSYIAYSYIFENKREKELKTENEILKKQFDIAYKTYLENERELQMLEEQDSNLYKVLFVSSPNFKKTKNNIDISELSGRKALKQSKKNKENVQNLLSSIKENNDDFINIWDTIDKKEINNIPSIIPIPRINDSEYLIYGFGKKMNVIYGINQFHSGIDIDATYNTPVLSTMDGKVKKVSYFDKTKGKYIIIQNGDYKTGFYHLEDIKVHEGQKVSKGQLIGTVGISGRSLLPHLHYEIQYKDEYVNPIFFIFMSVTPLEYSEIYKKSILTGISLD